MEDGQVDRLDDTDEHILAELARQLEATFAEIGARVNLSAPAVKRRVDRMLDLGVIRGFTTVIDRSALGWNTEAFVQVFCQGTIAPDQLRAAWIDIPGGQRRHCHGNRGRNPARAGPRYAALGIGFGRSGPPRGRTEREHCGPVNLIDRSRS